VVIGIILIFVTALSAQDVAVLGRAYDALRAKDYDTAIACFEQAIQQNPSKANIRKDLAYTYLKTGATEAARDQFDAAVRLEPGDYHTALEYAFLCYETQQRIEARRVFDRVRKSGDEISRTTAGQAFENVDRPLREGIARWTRAIEADPNDFSAHFELARLAEERDELDLAAAHYQRAWRLRPELRNLLVDMGRVAKAQGKAELTMSTLLAASRGAEPRTAEQARALMPARYPYVYEFRAALDLDPNNVELRRELAYLLLTMGKKDEAEQEFKIVTQLAPEDLLSTAQLGFLRLNRRDLAGAMPLLERVLKGDDEELADRVRSALKLPQTLKRRSETPRRKVSIEAKTLAARSYEKGYMKDALKYLLVANEIDPVDFNVMLKLGWTNNILKNDKEAVRWFGLARKSPDPEVATEADRAWKNLRRGNSAVRASAWIFPFYSSRWRDVFSYGQFKTDFRLGKLPLRPYLSTRFIGDTRGATGEARPQYLSESSLIFGAGLATNSYKGLMAWGEAGTAVSYLGGRKDVGTAIPDYRGGVAFVKGFGRLLGSESGGAFFETSDDGVFVSRFDNDFLFYSQNRVGYTFAPIERLGGFQMQCFWNQNLTADVGGQYWANFYEAGPGLRFRSRAMPRSLSFTASILRGVYLRKALAPSPTFTDFRIGFWYAIQ
jgi:tetratricopeptide (TPR) repeat protein